MEPVGGQFRFPTYKLTGANHSSIDHFLSRMAPGFHYTYTYGGSYSILKILQELNLSSNHEILVPSFMCPSILEPFKLTNTKYSFYDIQKDLGINTRDLERRVTTKVKGIFYINYFGFDRMPEEQQILQYFQDRGIKIIQDNVQGLYSKLTPLGDYIFYSLRKFLPLEGGLLCSKDKLTPPSKRPRLLYPSTVNLGRLLRDIQFFTGIKTEHLFIKLFERSEKEYFNGQDQRMTIFSKHLFRKYPEVAIREGRINNYKYVASRLNQHFIKQELSDIIAPLGCPILTPERNALRKFLINHSIFCPIHWRISKEVNRREFPDAHQLSESILTIPVHEELSKENLERTCNRIRKHIQRENIPNSRK